MSFMKKSKALKSACLGKIAHKTIISAQYVLDAMEIKQGHILHIYKCEFCKNFHIGHKLGTKPVKNPKS